MPNEQRRKTDKRTHRLVVTTRLGGRWLVYRRRGGGFTLGKGKRSLGPLLNDAELRDAVAWSKRRNHRARETLGKQGWAFLSKNTGTEWPTDRTLLKRLNRVGARVHRRVHIVSGLRRIGSPGDLARGNTGTQWYLWELFQSGRGNLAAYPNSNAPHVRGIAADCGVITRTGGYLSLGLWSRSRRVAQRLGLVANVPGEAWHYQVRGR